MNSAMNMLKRIRWIPVLSALIILSIIALLILSIPVKYSVKGKIGLSASAKPDKISVGEKSTLTIEVKNLDKNDEKIINIDAETFDDKFLFTKTEERTISRNGILVGPQEERKIEFDIKPTGNALPGKYRIDVTAREKSYPEGSKDTVYIKVEKD